MLDGFHKLLIQKTHQVKAETVHVVFLCPVFDAVHNVRTSGNKNDYIYWAKETVGISNAEVYPLWNGNGTVKVVVSGENRMPVDEEILQTCKNNIIENAPIGATLTVLTTTLFNVSINLSISIDESYDSSEVKLAVENAIKNYIGTCVDKIFYSVFDS